MPAASKARWAQLKIGVLAIVAFAVIAIFLVLKSGQSPLFRSSSDVYTFFGDSFAMTEGATPVRLNGILIGEVSKIELSGDSTPNRVVRVTLAIENRFLDLVPVDSIVVLAQGNLLGSRYVNIKRGLSQQKVQPGDELRSQDTSALEDLFQQGSTTLSALEAILKRVENIVVEIENGEGTIGKFLKDPKLYNDLVGTVNSTNQLVTNTNQLVTAFNNPDSTFGRLIYQDDLYQDIRGSMTRINRLLDGLEAGEGTAGKLLKDDTLHEELVKTIADLRQTLMLVNSGDGTIGKLMTSPELHDRLLTSMDKIDTLLNHINAGDGTLGQLVVNPQLYESMDGTMREVRGMMQDFRANPKKFLTIQLKLW